MSDDDQLGPPPGIDVEVVADHGAVGGHFMQLRTVELRCRYPDGSLSRPFPYQLVERKATDAVALVLWGRRDARPLVCLRSQLRPPLWFRSRYDVPVQASEQGAVQWEVPAGLIEPGERGQDGICRRAAAEALEEVGLAIDPGAFRPLGPPTSLSPGMCAEKLHFVVAEVDLGAARCTPPGDGHPLEEHATVVFVPLGHALDAVRAGRVHDLKTEAALYRLGELLREP